MSEIPLDLTSSARSRLREVLNHWKKAAESYFEPEEFRVCINACIQSLRNVTFALQKQKNEIPNFLEWYEGQWREALGNDPIMSWSLRARNIIVKEGDLKTKSIAKASLVISYMAPPINEFTVNPLSSTKLIAEEIAKKALPEELSKSGYLCVERQWVAENLTEVELLEALAHAFIVLTKLVNDVVLQKGPSIAYPKILDGKFTPQDIIAQEDPEDVPLCMQSFADYRVVMLKLPTREIVRITKHNSSVSKKTFEEARGRYGLVAFEVYKNGKTNAPASLKESVEYYMNIGKRILEVDGYHTHTIIFKDGRGEATLLQTSFEDQDDKYVIWNDVAKEVQRNKIVEVIFVGEAWFAQFDPKQPLRKACDSPDKTEVLQAIGITSKGEEFGIMAPFTNTDGKIVFDDYIEVDKAQASFLEPIRRVWITC
ncbi:MAG: hypothetical protein KAT46_04360 [Deltaproteobacteria bacterium]|nr:hypothetical protein [Deltaproteobacteria bacterium]